jgi:hypothetical protein
VRNPPPERGVNGRAALVDWGFDQASIEKLSTLGLGFSE